MNLSQFCWSADYCMLPPHTQSHYWTSTVYILELTFIDIMHWQLSIRLIITNTHFDLYAKLKSTISGNYIYANKLMDADIYHTNNKTRGQEGLAVASIARDDPSTLPGDNPFPHARMHAPIRSTGRSSRPNAYQIQLYILVITRITHGI